MTLSVSFKDNSVLLLQFLQERKNLFGFNSSSLNVFILENNEEELIKK